jgi:hypothetical protein
MQSGKFEESRLSWRLSKICENFPKFLQRAKFVILNAPCYRAGTKRKKPECVLMSDDEDGQMLVM